MMIDLLLATSLFVHLPLQTGAHTALPPAASILDRYATVTKGNYPGKNLALLRMEFSVTEPSGATYYATVYRDRKGNLHMAVDDDQDKRESGVSDGRAWTLNSQGVRLLTGKAAERVLAEARGWSGGSLADFAAGWGGGLQSDDWREAFPTATTVRQSTMHNEPCFEVVLTRTDGSTLHRWYEVRSGLLAHETTSEFDQAGVEQTYETDVANYETWLGLTYPTLLKIKSPAGAFTVKINSLFRGPASDGGAFGIPTAVAEAIAQANTPDGLPNPVALIERFAEVTGVKAQETFRSEILKMNLSLTGERLKIPVVLYAAGRKSYLSFDVPTMGKMEFGSNGEIAWQRSVVLGPQLLPGTGAMGMIGPDVAILSLEAHSANLRTTGKGTVDGADCYVVEVRDGPQDKLPTKAYFEVKSGYLVRMDTAASAEAPPDHTTLRDYRKEGDVMLAHHVEKSIGGKATIFDITEVQFNGPLPEGIFDLPGDVAELLQHERQGQKQTDANAPPRPTLKRSQPQ